MGTLNRHEKKKNIKMLAQKWEQIAELIAQKLDSRLTRDIANNYISLVKSTGIIEKTFLVIDSCVEDYKFVQN